MELLRIIAMFMVVTLHCLGNGLLAGNQELSAYNLILVRVLDSFCLIANVLFFLLTGYYQIDKKVSIKKVLTLWGKTIFYALSILVICQFLHIKTYLYASIFPVLSGEYWFISAYIALYMLLPIVNIMLNKLTKHQFTYLIVALLLMCGIIEILFNPAGMFSRMTNVLTIYCIGAFIKKFVEVNNKGKYYLTKYFLLGIILVLLYFVIKVLCTIVTDSTILYVLLRIKDRFCEYYNLLVLIMAILMFMKFRTLVIKSKKISKVITFISPSVFSIYLIHQNINLRAMWLNFGMMNYSNSLLLLPYALLLITLVFLACLCIDLLRRGLYLLLKRIKFINKFIEYLNCGILNFDEKLNHYIGS